MTSGFGIFWTIVAEWLGVRDAKRGVRTDRADANKRVDLDERLELIKEKSTTNAMFEKNSQIDWRRRGKACSAQVKDQS